MCAGCTLIHVWKNPFSFIVCFRIGATNQTKSLQIWMSCSRNSSARFISENGNFSFVSGQGKGQKFVRCVIESFRTKLQTALFTWRMQGLNTLCSNQTLFSPAVCVSENFIIYFRSVAQNVKAPRFAYECSCFVHVARFAWMEMFTSYLWSRRLSMHSSPELAEPTEVH